MRTGWWVGATLAVSAQFLGSGRANADIEEITVTAEKHAERASEVGIALQAFDGQQLKEDGVADVGTLAAQIPNVEFTTSANLPSFSIRGVGLNEFQTNFDSPVGVNIDEVNQSKPFMMSMPTFDVDRVEVLKGPQGTLFGRNTIGGAVNYYLEEPTPGTSGGLTVNAGSYWRFTTEGFFNTPLTDNLLLRVSAYSAEAGDGPYKNLYDGGALDVPRQTEERVQLKWTEDDTTVRLMVYGGQDRSSLVPYKSPGIFNDGGGICPAVLNGTINDDPGAAGDCFKFAGLTANPTLEHEPSDPFTVDAKTPNVARNSAYGGYLRVSQETGLGTVTSLTGFEYFNRQQNENADDTPTVTASTFGRDVIDQISQEFRLAGEAGRWQYVGGLFFENDLQRQKENADFLENPLGILPPAFPRLAETLNQETSSVAGYLNNEVSLTDSITLVAGLRYSVDMLKADAATFLGGPGMGADGSVAAVVPVDALKKDQTYYNFSYRAGINYRPAERQLLYFNATTGYRSGGFSVPFGGVITQFAPEKIMAYEIGWKAALIERTLELDTALFRYDYTNLQVNVDDPSSPIVPVTRNIGASTTEGVEENLLWAPDEAWTAELGVGYLDAAYSATDRTITTYGGTIALEGKRPVNAPPWTVNARLRYERPVNDEWVFVGTGGLRWTDKRSLRPAGQPYDVAPAYAVADLRLALQSTDDAWEIALWGKNIFDETYLTYVNNVSFFKLDIYGEPATYGITVSRKF